MSGKERVGSKVEEKLVEIKQVSERETWVGESRFYLGENNILHVTVVGDTDEQMAIAYTEASTKLRNMVEGKVHDLIDINRAGRQTSGARKIGQERFEDEKTGKVALIGMHPVARVLGTFVIGMSRKKNFRFFKKREEALAWLKQ